MFTKIIQRNGFIILRNVYILNVYICVYFKNSQQELTKKLTHNNTNEYYIENEIVYC